MKKLIYGFLLLVFSFTCLSYGCKRQEFSLANYLTELRENIYEGESEHYKIKADYGFIKNESGSTVYQLTFKMKDVVDTNVTYLVCFDLGEKSYQKNFTFSPVHNILTAIVEVDCFNKDSFDITIKKASESENITLNSIIPPNTIDYKTALNYLYQGQKTYIDSFIDNGEFKAKLTERIVVKDDKGYYYIGIENENGKLKAMLIDGISGELLAIRDVFMWFKCHCA